MSTHNRFKIEARGVLDRIVHDRREAVDVVADALADAELRGRMEGVKLYAWWKDGIQYVGKSGDRLSDVLFELGNGQTEPLQ